MLNKILTVLSASVLLAACQSTPTEVTGTSPTSQAVRQAIVLPDQSAPQPQAMEPATDLWQRIGRQLTWQSIHNSQVGKARDNFLSQSTYLEVVSLRASLYLFYIVEEVERRGMPMEIALLPMVESTLNPFANSSAHAAGLWQIMPATGKHLGLERDWWYDGRRDLRDSTRVALDYLEALHQEFDQDWLLALAAYNSGKGRVARSRRANADKGLPTDYWSIKLPRETRNYVPKLIALSQIVAYPQAFSVTLPQVPNEPAFEIADTGGQLEMSRAAKLAGVELETLRALNPGQLRWATSPDMPPELLLPVGSASRFSAGVAELKPEDRVQWHHYQIARGDNLIGIAKKYDTDVALLRQVNDIRGSMIRAGKTLMIPVGSDWQSSLAMADSGPAQPRGYKVRRGDSLYRIAGKFGVSINDIVSWNALDPGKHLQPGQKLTLYVRGT